jgi:hypothetical protein
MQRFWNCLQSWIEAIFWAMPALWSATNLGTWRTVSIDGYTAIPILHPVWSRRHAAHPWENEKCQGRRPATEKKPGRGRAGGRCSGGATKPPMPRLAVVEAAELACELRVWGVRVLGLGVWGSPATEIEAAGRGEIRRDRRSGQFAGAEDGEGGGQSGD